MARPKNTSGNEGVKALETTITDKEQQIEEVVKDVVQEVSEVDNTDMLVIIRGGSFIGEEPQTISTNVYNILKDRKDLKIEVVK